jgi:precorrin-6Y C5,15-methyltransferase (decarboxylating) CbiT subunit
LTLKDYKNWEVITPGLPDEAFIRGKVPMTKEEVRVLTIVKARLTGKEVVYDIGAGTGSISIEMARLLPVGKVYAIEQNPEGVELIKLNARQLGVENVVVCQGYAPEAFLDLPKPDRVIIGGSGGKMDAIFKALLPKLSSGARLVINAITLESIHEATKLAETHLENVEIIQVNISRAEKLGSYHLMKGQNPIYIIAGDIA